MYRVMIVDDEALERQGLHLILEKHFGEQIEITDANNGKKAIEMAYMIKPDIVFMDMKMPGIDGIDAIKAIQAISHATKFVVVSAYDSFNYAQKAISMNVFAYLLKPVKRKDIIGCMDRLLTSKKIEIEKMHDDLELKQQVQEIKPFFEQEFVHSVINNNKGKIISLSDMQLLDQSWEYSYCMVLNIKDLNLNTSIDDQEKIMHKRRLEERLSRYLKDQLQAVVGSASENRILAIIPITEDAWIAKDNKTAKSIGETLIKIISETSDSLIEIGIGNPVSEIQQINRSYNEALKALNHKQNELKVVHVNDIDYDVDATHEYPFDDEKSLCIKVQQGLKTESQIMFNCVFNWIDNYVGTVEEKRIKLLELTAVLDRSITEKVNDLKWLQESRQILDKNINQSDISRLKIKLWSDISKVIDEINLLRERNMDSIINKAKDYIRKNYVHEISLEEISQFVSVSPYYFSKLFKQQTGENFIDFLTYVRIEKAKEILRTTDLSMKVIARKVGYKDPNYFSRVFKKVTEMKPSDFRQK